ncbi:hypothetical protein DIPPA_18552 [Diplonema papillatum]|nr:hypothetical protein DIPPA_18552 [Diplonema papillatum]
MLLLRVLATALATGSLATAAKPINGNPHVERIGTDMRVVPEVESGKECSALCLDEARCEGWTWYSCEKQCKLMRKSKARKWSSGACAGESGTAQQLGSDRLYKTVPLGWTAATGWLLAQLKIEADGQLSRLNQLKPDLADDAAWVDDTQDDTVNIPDETGPYWLNGLVPSAALLNASALLPEHVFSGILDEDVENGNPVTKKLLSALMPTQRLAEKVSAVVEKRVWRIISDDLPSSLRGPADGFCGAGDDFKYGWHLAAALLQYADAHAGDEAAAASQAAVVQFIGEMYVRALELPLDVWSSLRYQDLVYLAQTAYDQNPMGQEQLLVDFMRLVNARGFEWDDHYSGHSVRESFFPMVPNSTWARTDDGVTHAMATKAEAVAARLQDRTVRATVFETQLAMQHQYHGQPYGTFAAAEGSLGGRNLTRGVDVCAAVEQMHSLDVSFHQFGDVHILDKAERIAFNALPGSLTPDLWQHQYLAHASDRMSKYLGKPNLAKMHGATVKPATVESCTDHPQGVPIFAKNVVLTFDSHGLAGLAVGMFAPVDTTIRAGALDGTRVEIKTDYPFGDTVGINVTVPETVPMLPFRVRIPGWADRATLVVVNGTSSDAKNGTMCEVTLTPGTTELVLELRPEVRVEFGWGAGDANAAAVVRGPLLFSHGLDDQDGVWAPFNNSNTNVTYNATWNYALSIDPRDAASSFSVVHGETAQTTPFNNPGYPVYIQAKARLMPRWVPKMAFWGKRKVFQIVEPPRSPSFCSDPEACGAEVNVTLVPFGATDLRVSAFPWICDAPAASCFENAAGSRDTKLVVDYGGVMYGDGTSPHRNAHNMLLRSGRPKMETNITVSQMIFDPTRKLSSLSVSYQYQTSSKLTSTKPAGTVMKIGLVNAMTNEFILAYESPPLTDYLYNFNGTYSPPVTVTAALDLAVTQPHQIRFRFFNNGKNVNLLTPLTFHLKWD